MENTAELSSGVFMDSVMTSIFLMENGDIHWGCIGAYFIVGYLTLCVVVFLYSSVKGVSRGSQLNYHGTGIKKQASDILTPGDQEYVAKSKKILLETERQMITGKSEGYVEGANYISALLKSKIIDVGGLMRENAQELFLMHRETGPLLEGGVGVRVTVQLNLFGGSVANLGDDTQRTWLQGVFNKGELGCFCLTEKGAGVLSGLVVNTTATFRPAVAATSSRPSQPAGFVLHSPTVASHKTWISQGLTARWGVVIARLVLQGGVDKGPHAFVIDMNADGVVKEDMPQKTDFNGLDNANIWFESVNLPLDSLLRGISSVSSDGEYQLVNPDVPFRFVSVAQRLLSGRICIAGAAISQLRKVFDEVAQYSKARLIPTGRDLTTPLAELPVMRDTLDGIDASMAVFRHYVRASEESFMSCKTITNELVNQIASGKIEVVGYCIDAVLSLKAHVGSLSLQETGPFGTATDILYVYRFAEGDSAILQQKLARDALKRVQTVPGLLAEVAHLPLHWLSNRNGAGAQRIALSVELIRLAVSMIGLTRQQKMTAWFAKHRQIERIAKLKAMLTVYDTVAHRAGLTGSRELALFKKLHLDPL
eukprot:m.19969 g.19969  ORF g.19969 m.19969 type:complete len:594 (-) comp11997_c0_seq2:318-2099(-)